MNILFVSEYYPPNVFGGGEINLELLAAALAKKKVQVSVLTSYQRGQENIEKRAGVTIYRRLKTGKNPSKLLENVKRSLFFPKSIVTETLKILRQEKVDAIHFIGTSLIAAPKLKSCGMPLFATIESYPALCPKGDLIFHGKNKCIINCSAAKFLSCQRDSTEIGKMKNKWYLKFNAVALAYIYNHYYQLNNSLKYCNLIAISKYVEDLLQKRGHGSTVIPNFLDIAEFSKNASNNKKEKNKKIKLLYLGSLIPSKGAQVLLEAIKGLNIECEIYGRGVLKEELQRKIKLNHLPAKIFDSVPYSEIPSIYAETDIVVFPSLWQEPFGRIAIEAMASGKPVVGSAIGGIKETITEDTGILVEPGNIEQLRIALKQLIDDKKLRKKLGQEGRKKVEELYNEETVIEKLMKIYNNKISPSLSDPGKP